MDQKKVYKVLFKGIILTGFDKDSVIDNVHNITRIPKETISRKFFSGKTVVIRHADSREYAGRLQKTFAQAGIETYIEEVLESVTTKDEINSSEQPDDWQKHTTNHDTREQHTGSEKKVINKLVLIAGIAIVLVAIIGTFFISRHKPSDQQQVQPESIKPSEQQQIADSQSLINTRDIISLIKITGSSELPRLNRYLALYEINPEYLEILKQLKDFRKSISINNPVYVFQTNTQKGIVFYSSAFTEKKLLPQIQKQIDVLTKKLYNQQACTKNQSLKPYQSKHTFLLISPFRNNTKSGNIERFINSLSESLKQLSSQDFSTGEPPEAMFEFYYRFPPTGETHSLATKSDTPPGTSYLSLSAWNDSFRLSSSKEFFQSNDEIMKQLGISHRQTQTISALPIRNLVDLTLLLISQTAKDTLFKDTPNSKFNQENIITINPSFNVKNIQDYNKNLDIEHLPQWQSGPFAIATNNYQFTDQLNIELLAKGQNIDNIMEYSQSAKMTVHSAYNNKKLDIISNKCHESAGNHFKDLDGEQEAYINDDFVSYHVITTKNTVSIKPGQHIENIEKIVGDIQLNLPEKILYQTIKNPSRLNLIPFEHFTMITRLNDKNTIDFQLIGDKEYFQTLRAYNQSGDILETTQLKRQPHQNNLIHHFQQTFSEPIHTIKIFHTKKYRPLIYNFSFKPQIIAVSNPLSAADAKPVKYNDANLKLQEVSKNILSDNPQWLGTSIATEKLGPFHINLFLPQGLQDNLITEDGTLPGKPPGIKPQKKDAVINIKTATTPLIRHNMTAVHVLLKQGDNILLNDFVAFNEKESFSNDSIDAALKKELYLNSNTTLQITESDIKEIQGVIRLKLPIDYKSHSSNFLSPGQSIKLGDVLIKPILLSRQQVQFEINGNIAHLLQVKLYNHDKKLISEPLELKQLKQDKALLTLLYNDKIETIKLILAVDSNNVEYPFTFVLPD